MSLKNSLTNEKLTKRFESPFSLVNYAISIARTKMERGEEADTNLVSDVLETIACGRDVTAEEESASERDAEKEVQTTAP